MPEQPTNEKKKVDGEPKKISAPEADKAVEKVTNLSKSSETSTSTKRRFSDSTQDSQSSSSTQITTNDRPNPTTTTKNPSPARTTSSNPRTANQWEKTAFVGDSDGAKRVKFLRLMGLGKTATIDAKPESPEEATKEAAKRQQQSANMERQYEQGRRRRNRFS